MPRYGSFTVSDLIGKFDHLVIECSKCERYTRCSVAKLALERGPDAMLTSWMEEITADCPRVLHGDFSECRAYFPQLLTKK